MSGFVLNPAHERFLLEHLLHNDRVLYDRIITGQTGNLYRPV